MAEDQKALEVGIDPERGEVVMDFCQDMTGITFLSLSPDQARHLAGVLNRKAVEIDQPEGYRHIPVEEAKRLAESYDKSMVVILAYDPTYIRTHSTTYGTAAFEKEQAAAIAERCVQDVCGGDLSEKCEFEDFHKDMDPARLKEATEILSLIARRNGTTPQMLQQVERWLKAAGHGVREG